MELVKKNIISIICGVVALACVGAWYFWLSGQQAELQTKLAASKADHDALAGLLSKSRQLPTVDPDNPTVENLKQFPSQNVIEQGEQITKQVEKESVAMRDAAVAMNQHALLEPGSLPAPNSTAAYNFRRAYAVYFPPPVQGPLASQLAKDLNAGIPPTQDELAKRAADLEKQVRTKRQILDAQGLVINADAVKQELDEKLKELPNVMRKEIAEQHKVYISPATFEPFTPVLAALGQPNALDIYQAQLTLWIQQDVVAAVNDANRNARNILEAPVKHLIKVTAPPAFIVAPESAGAQDPDGTLPKAPAYSPTQRVSNGLYDVFHFSIDVDVEAARAVEFIRELGRNRFVTARWWDLQTVDNALEMAEGRVYGDKPCVRLHIECETLYLRKWNAPLMPKSIRDRLGIPADGAAPGAAPAPPAAVMAQ